jgi:hypothetical protein
LLREFPHRIAGRRVDVQFLSAILAFDCGAFSGRLDFAFCACGVNLDLSVGSAFSAEALVIVPTGIAGVTHTASASMEVLRGLLDGGRESLVVRLAIASLGQAFGGGFHVAQHSAENARSLAEPTGCLSSSIGNKLHTPGVAAALAIKLELKACVVTRTDGVVFEVLAELDFAHGRLV